MLEYWYAALASTRGVKIRVSDLATAQRRLYKARADAADPSLESLALVPSPTSPEELWIVKRTKDAS